MCVLCSKSRYGYHITSRSNLESIRRVGLKCVKLRSGSWTASEGGSFLTNKQANLPTRIRSALNAASLKCLRAGLTAQQVVDAPQPRLIPLIDVPVTGSIDDNIQVEAEFNDNIAMYVTAVGPGAARKATGPEGTALGASLVGRTDHFLNRLAESYIEWCYAFEEKITGNHVYFFVRNHKAKYEQYLALNGGADGAVVLRVELKSLHGHDRDMSDGFAVMTPSVVLPSALAHAFPEPAFLNYTGPDEMDGSNIKIWEQYGKWTPLV